MHPIDVNQVKGPLIDVDQVKCTIIDVDQVKCTLIDLTQIKCTLIDVSLHLMCNMGDDPLLHSGHTCAG